MKPRSKNRLHREGLARRATCGACVFALLAAQAAPPVIAGPYEQARRIYERLAGVQPSSSVLQMMANDISSQPGQTGLLAAAAIATNPQYAPDFYDVTLKEFVNPWTNRNQSAFVPFNDYTATVIGMIRDDIPFNTVLSANILYTVNASGLPAPSAANNNHYATAEANGVDFSTALTQTSQTAVYGTPGSGRRGHLDHARRRRRLLRAGYEPGAIPLHHAELPLPRHAAGHGQHPAHRPDPPGCGALTRR